MNKAERVDREPVAIIGMSCRVPGASSPDALWKMVAGLQEGVSEYPGGRTRELDAFYARVGLPDGPVSTRGGFLPDIDRFDAAFFEISPREAEWLDPQQRLLLETSWEALEDAGIPLEALPGGKTGVFVGVWSNEYERHAAANSEVAEFFLITGGPLYGVSSRIAYQFDLRGPDVSVNAACGSSLVAVHLACRSLRSGESSVALAGGVNVVVRHETTQAFSRSQMLSPDGRCKFGDASADGFVRSDGVGMLVLKRLSDARQDGDRILGIIRGTAMANDGRGSGLLATPSAAGQRQAMLDALADAGCEPSTVDYVDAHGTGTRAGDPIEISAIASVFGRTGNSAQPCRIGSVKSNIGHTESAAGVISIIRTLLAMQHGKYPATLHVNQPNPAIDWQAAGVMLQREGSAWEKPQGVPRRASVNGLGLTGTNVHVILEGAAPAERTRTASPSAFLLPLSAACDMALAQRAADIAAALRSLQEPGELPGKAVELPAEGGLNDLCYTAAVRRTHLTHRLAVSGASAADLSERLEAFVAGRESASVSAGSVANEGKPGIAFVFPGQGSQWLGMGRELLRDNAIFRQSLTRIDEAIQRETGWSVLQQLEDATREDRLSRIDIVQPTLFAVEVALAEVWRSWGIIPGAVVGHSMGEIAAACAAGILSLDDAVRIICRRSALLTRVAGMGAMAVVDLPRGEAEALLMGLEDKISIAVSNSPRSTVLAGDPAALNGIVESLENRDVFCRWVRVDVASHSPQMDPLLDDLYAALTEVRPQQGFVPMCSSVRAGIVESVEMDAAYWVENLRQPVLFANAIQELLKQGFNTFVEMSAHPLLVPFVEQTADESGHKVLAVASLRREEPEMASLLTSLGVLYAAGADVAWRGVYPQGNLVKLPPYPWQRERFWMESQTAQTTRFQFHSGHPLLGEPLQTATGEWIWTAKLTTASHSWLKDHAVGGAALLPASAYIELAAAAAGIVLGDGSIVQDLDILEAAPLSPANPLELQVIAARESEDVAFLKVFCREKDAAPWTQMAGCTLRRAPLEKPRKVDPATWIASQFSSSIASGVQHAQRMAELGYSFGPFFQRLKWLALESDRGLARIDLPEELRREAYLMHPAALDAALQVIGRLLIEASPDHSTLLPIAIGAAEFYSSPLTRDALLARATVHHDGLTGDVDIFDLDGHPLVAIRGAAFRPLERTSSDSTAESPYQVEWQKLNADHIEDRAAAGGRWLLIAGRASLAADLADSLTLRGASATVMHPAQILHGEIDAATPIQGVVWLTPLDLDADAALAEAKQVLAAGATLVSRLAEAGPDGAVPPRLWMLTRAAQTVNGEPVTNVLAAGAWGFFASASNEYPGLHASSVDLPALRIEAEPDLLAALLLSDAPEDRVALREDGWFAARLDRFHPAAHSAPKIAVGQLRTTQHEAECFELQQTLPGSLDSFELVSKWTEPLQPDEVEIAVEAAGLNFLDVLRAMGINGALAASGFGGECAGTVIRVGIGVTAVQPGDEVLAISPSFKSAGMFASRVRVPETLVAKKPESMSFAQAAGIPCVFLTAWYGLVKLAQLQEGERVLIHAAAGGVGLAAIQIAKWIGAEIYATVGSDEKREYLRSLGVRHIMHSRKLDFAREIHEATNGNGVDVVLNSLAGPAIGAGLEALATYGRFVEIGKRDIWENSRIGLNPFRKNLSLFAVDLAQSVEDRREMVGAMLVEVMELFRLGALQPIPTTLYPVSEAAGAFQLMAKGAHIGKIVLNLRDSAAMIRRDLSRLAPDATYLITGGLGGLGLATAQAFVERGARHLVLTSRRDPSHDAIQALRRLEAGGAAITIRLADVSTDAEALLAGIRATMPPLRGVVHAAGVLDDAVVSHLTIEKFDSVMAGKVQGALALDKALLPGELDFLVYYSSVAGVLGSPGQANYAAANTMLDALALAQRARGIPAISIAWGTWGEVGLAAASENRGARMASRGLRSLSRAEGAKLVTRILEVAPAHVVAAHLDADQWCASHPAAAQSRFLANLMRQSATASRGDGDFAASLAVLEGDELRAALSVWLRQQIAAVLRLDAARIPDDKTLRSLGLDSLMALELRNRLERHLGLKFAATLVWNYPTVSALAAHLAGRLSPSHREDSAAGANAISNLVTKPSLTYPADNANRSAAEMLELELLGAESLLGS